MKYKKEHQFNYVYARNNLPKIKNGTYIIYLDEYFVIATP